MIRLAQRRIVDDSDPLRRHPHCRGDFRRHCGCKTGEMVDQPALHPAPQPVQRAHRRRHVGAAEVVGDFQHDRRAAPAQQQLHRHCHHGIAVAGGKQHIGTQRADLPGEHEHHPQCFPASGGQWPRSDNVQRQSGRRLGGHHAFGAPHHQLHLEQRRPGTAQPQRDPLHPAGFEAVQEDHDPGASAGHGNRSA